MNQINPKDFGKITKELIDEVIEETIDISIEEKFNMLVDELNSPPSNQFTIRMNEMYRSNNIKDENDNYLKVVNPSASVYLAIKGDRIYNFSLSVEEERWFRADELYGNRILSKLGLKYSSD